MLKEEELHMSGQISSRAIKRRQMGRPKYRVTIKEIDAFNVIKT
jgi:predicted ArsR family transcriptional regulator